MASRLKYLKILLLIVLLQFPLAAPSASAGEPESALLIKVSFLLNFLKFTQWPPGSFPAADQELLLAVLGEDPMAALVKKTLEGRLIKDKPIKVSVYANVQLWQQAGKVPHALFVSHDMFRQWTDISAALATAPVLTMADFPDFCAQGGILNLVRDGDSIRFEANPEAARKASLTLNAQMLQLAEIVSTQKNEKP